MSTYLYVVYTFMRFTHFASTTFLIFSFVWPIGMTYIHCLWATRHLTWISSYSQMRLGLAGFKPALLAFHSPHHTCYRWQFPIIQPSGVFAGLRTAFLTYALVDLVFRLPTIPRRFTELQRFLQNATALPPFIIYPLYKTQ